MEQERESGKGRKREIERCFHAKECEDALRTRSFKPHDVICIDVYA